MVTLTPVSPLSEGLEVSQHAPEIPEGFSLEDFMTHPPEHMEWVDGQLVEKTGIALKHGRIQAKLATYWRNYKDSSGQGGEVYTDTPCRTQKQGRRPDVAYLTPELVTQFGESAALPQSFPLIAEIASPADMAEELFGKAQEYIQSGCEEVWMVFPESRWVFVLTKTQHLWVTAGEVASTQAVIRGFSVPVDELLG